MSRTSSARPLRAALVGLALALVGAVAFALPASAHDELISSTPASGETVSTVPAAVTLSFSAEVMTDGLAAQVNDASGTDWASGEPTVDADTVTIPVKADIPNGAYTAIARVVSQDGHPVEVTVSFTIDAPRVAASSPTATEESAAAPATPEPVMTTLATPAATDSAEGGNPVPWVIGVGIVVVLVAGLGAILWGRGRADRADRA